MWMPVTFILTPSVYMEMNKNELNCINRTVLTLSIQTCDFSNDTDFFALRWMSVSPVSSGRRESSRSDTVSATWSSLAAVLQINGCTEQSTTRNTVTSLVIWSSTLCISPSIWPSRPASNRTVHHCYQSAQCISYVWCYILKLNYIGCRRCMPQ